MSTIEVTITGADDNVSFDDMAKLSAEFPFVEWGVLFSESRRGMARYPSVDWIVNAGSRFWSPVGAVRLSAHLCGSIARRPLIESFYAKEKSALHHVGSTFQRVQINGYEIGRAFGIDYPIRHAHTYILQACGPAMIYSVARDARMCGATTAILYDPSGGEGYRPKQWPYFPKMPNGIRVGYAGGIGPSNVAEVIAEIREANDGADPAWVDMESGVRGASDRLDLAAVREVLETVARIRMAA